MKKKSISLILITLLLLIFPSCSQRTIATNTPLSVIKFDNHTYPKTDPLKIKLYTSRKDIPEKYIEIGTIKFERNAKIEDVKQLAGDSGADAIILEGNNYILIIFQEIKKEEEQNEYKTI